MAHEGVFDTPSIQPKKLSFEELGALKGVDTHTLEQLALWASKNTTCSHCKKCTLRCEVLKGPALDIGMVEEGFDRIMALSPEDRPAAVRTLVKTRPEVYKALRSCCFCGFCTASCKRHKLAPDIMRRWRVLFLQAGYMPPKDSSLVMVDNEWHIFNAYRAIYGIGYPQFLSLAQAAATPGSADTLFFPGCSLVSYAPDLTCKIGEFLNAVGIKWALSDDCCGSPLMSAGMFTRADALRKRIVDQMRAAGITRMVTVCPGCGEEFRDDVGDDIEIVPLPEILLEHVEELKQARAAWQETEIAVPSVTVFDSCHDRADGRHGKAIRALLSDVLPQIDQKPLDHSGEDALCCGAGGAVSSYNDALSQKRVTHVINVCKRTGADTVVTMCPTCTYTIAQAVLGATPQNGKPTMNNRHYLELLFNQPIDWAVVFDQLGSMWTGEYAAWLTQTFF